MIVDAARRLGTEVEPDEAAGVWAEIDQAAADPEEAALGRDLDEEVWQARWSVLYGLADRLAPGLGAAINSAMHDPWAWLPYADTVPTLEALATAGIPVGVVSNTGWDVREPFAVRGLDRLVSSFTLSCEIGVAKPDRSIFTAACASLGVPLGHRDGRRQPGGRRRRGSGGDDDGARPERLRSAPPMVSPGCGI